MSHVWIINHYATDPQESAAGSRHFSLARGLIDFGWKPTILAASTDHPSGRRRTGMENRRATDRLSQGVKFRFISTPTYQTGIGRLVNILAFTLQLLRVSTVKDLAIPKVIIGSTVHPLAAWASSVIARRMNVPFVFEIRDLWPQTLIDMGKIHEKGIPALLMRLLEKKLCDRAAAVITLLPFAHEYLTARGIEKEKIYWISNGTSISDFSQISKTEKSDNFTFMYLGSIGRANGVKAIIDGFEIAARSDPKIQLVVVGNGKERRALECALKYSDVCDRVKFQDPVPRDAVPTLITKANALVVNVLDLDVYRYGVSMNKLFDYAASAKPIVIATNARNDIVNAAGAGITVPANDILALGKAMRDMASASEEQRRIWGQNGRKHVAELYDYQVLAGHLNDVLMNVTSKELT
ncbi:glycosyltransferase family 4 protein [Glutamicibacter bergerei]